MDEPRSSKFEIKWQLDVGDIVRVRRADIKSYNTFDYGIVVEQCKQIQLNIFPLIEVFMFRTSKIENLQHSLLEVVSPRYSK